MFVLQVNTNGNQSLHFTDGLTYQPRASQIPIWGTAVVFDSKGEAEQWLHDSYMEDSADMQYVRLVFVADYVLLKRMVDPGKEVVRSSEAGLYIIVAPTCPAYHALWDSGDAREHTHSVVSFLDRGASRQTLLNTFDDNVGGAPAPCCLYLHRASATGGGAEILVDPGVSVVRDGWSIPVDCANPLSPASSGVDGGGAGSGDGSGSCVSASGEE